MSEIGFFMIIAMAIVYICICARIGYIAEEKGFSNSGHFWMSIFFSPLLGLLMVIALPDRKNLHTEK